MFLVEDETPLGKRSRRRPRSDRIGCAMDRSRAASVLLSATPMPRRLSVWLKPRGAAGAIGIRAAADRALMIIGLTGSGGVRFRQRCRTLGFIVAADDPRRRIIACAGAPICSSAYIAARALAPRAAGIAASHLDGSRQGSHLRLCQGLRSRRQRGAHNCRLARWVRADRQRLGARHSLRCGCDGRTSGRD